MLSHGVPMILGGDEICRTQHGNNNAWCQDNEVGWVDWSLLDENSHMLRFTRELIALRKRHPSLRPRRYVTGKAVNGFAGMPDVRWHGANLDEPNWDDPDGVQLAGNPSFGICSR